MSPLLWMDEMIGTPRFSLFNIRLSVCLSICLSIGALSLLASCATIEASKVPDIHLSSTLEPGSIVIAKKLPSVTALESMPLYGFLPFQPIVERTIGMPAEAWGEIQLASGTVSIQRGTESVAKLAVKGSANLLEGKTRILAVVEDPTWMAPDSYFIERGLPIPPEGDASRFLKGALGNLAIFLENGMMLHSGPNFEDLDFDSSALSMTAPEGARLDEASLKVIGSLLHTGSKIVIR